MTAKAPRLAVLGLGHETNTFSTQLATLAKYEDGGLHRGAGLSAHYATSETTFAGFLAPAAVGETFELVPLLAGWINPCGAITARAFQVIVNEMTELLAASGPIDGVLLGLHGAAVAEGHPDADSAIAAQVRAVVGPDVPIGAVVDMHANLEPRLVDLVDVLLPYQTNPHVDARDRGLECRTRILELIDGAPRPGLALIQLPLVVSITRQDTREQPMRALLEYAIELESGDGVLDVSLVEGFPYADVEQMGMSVLASHRDGAAAAAGVAAALAERVWVAREGLQGHGLSVSAAVEAIRGHRGAQPMLVLDIGDNVGAGGPGDSTALLAQFVAQEVDGVVTVLLDPQAVARLESEPLGAQVSLAVGGRSPEQDGGPVFVEASLVGRSSGTYEEPTMAHGGLRFFDVGPMVALRTSGGITVVLTTKLVQPITPRQLEAVGLVPASFRAIVAKGVNGPRAGYAEVCDTWIEVDTPGVTRLSLSGFEYLHRRRPLYPFESVAHWSYVDEI